MNGAQAILVLAGLACLSILVAIVLMNWRNPFFWLSAFWKLAGPVISKRGTPEQEKAANENYRRGGDGNIPLPAQRPGKGSIWGKIIAKKNAPPKGEI